MQTQQGFTLFEFVLVLLIGSILWGLSLRGFHHLDSFRASLIYEEIIQLLNLGHKISKASNKPVTVYCLDNHVYLSKKFDHFILQENAANITVPKRIKLNCSPEITFWPSGQVVADNMYADRFEWSVAEFPISIDGYTAYVY